MKMDNEMQPSGTSPLFGNFLLRYVEELYLGFRLSPHRASPPRIRRPSPPRGLPMTTSASTTGPSRTSAPSWRSTPTTMVHSSGGGWPGRGWGGTTRRTRTSTGTTNSPRMRPMRTLDGTLLGSRPTLTHDGGERDFGAVPPRSSGVPGRDGIRVRGTPARLRGGWPATDRSGRGGSCNGGVSRIPGSAGW